MTQKLHFWTFISGKHQRVYGTTRSLVLTDALFNVAKTVKSSGWPATETLLHCGVLLPRTTTEQLKE